jgi:hypothetical protein
MATESILFIFLVIGAFGALAGALAYGQWASGPAMRKGAYAVGRQRVAPMAWRGRNAVKEG